VSESEAARWARDLAAWAIPDEILAQAPTSPWEMPVDLFAAFARDARVSEPTATHRRAAEAMPEGGTVLDVGAGGGAASLPIAPPAAHVVAVDQSQGMLDALVAIAEANGIGATAVPGVWPDVAPTVGTADVVVCANVFYNVADLVPFVRALTDHARVRVVAEFTSVHPLTWLADLWRHFWGIERPHGPTAEDALAVVAETIGRPVESAWSPRPATMLARQRETQVARARVRLCLTEAADAEIARELEVHPPPDMQVVTAWWDGAA
jgi:SAM-dependent methyltransferase